MKTPINYCASYQDLTSSNSQCGMKRDSCALNNGETDRLQLNQNMQNVQNIQNISNYDKLENGFKQQQDDQMNPPDTGKQSESTVEIERIIEKNTTDQVKFFFVRLIFNKCKLRFDRV